MEIWITYIFTEDDTSKLPPLLFVIEVRKKWDIRYSMWTSRPWAFIRDVYNHAIGKMLLNTHVSSILLVRTR